MYCYLVVEAMNMKAFRQLDQNVLLLILIYSKIRKQMTIFRSTSGIGSYLATRSLLSLGLEYLQLLTTVFSHTCRDHFPLYKSGVWLSPASSISFKTMEISR